MKMLGNIDTWLALWLASYMCNTLAVSHTPCSGVFLHTCMWVALYMVLRSLPIEHIGKRHWAYLCACLGLWQTGMGVGQLLGVCDSGHYLYAVTGSFFNPAPYGAFIAVMSVVVIAVYKEQNERALGIAAIVMVVMLPASWSRAALTAFALCLGILYRKWVRRHWLQVSICTLVVMLVLYLIKRGSADSRILMMWVSLKAWMENLWTGVGAGGYLNALGEGMAAYFTRHPASVFISSVGVASLPFNEPLRIAVEQGLAGLLPLVMATLLAARRLWLAGSPLFYALLALLVFSLFSYPFTLPAFCAVLTVIMAYASSLGQQGLSRPTRVGTFIAAILTGVFAYNQLSPRLEAEKEYDRFSHISEKAFIRSYYDLFPFMNDNPQFLFRFGSLLRDCGRHNDSNAMFRQGASLSADPMFHILMGRNYEDMREYAKADSLYEHAFRRIPNRIYPLYRQMKLYEHMGDSIRMQAKANAIAGFVEKVESPATRSMKQEAKEKL